jgi:hypothetical protein
VAQDSNLVFHAAQQLIYFAQPYKGE